jgi:hypothetical protein
MTALRSPGHQFSIGRVWAADMRPMNRFKSGCDKKVHPNGRQIHIDQQLHQ